MPSRRRRHHRCTQTQARAPSAGRRRGRRSPLRPYSPRRRSLVRPRAPFHLVEGRGVDHDESGAAAAGRQHQQRRIDDVGPRRVPGGSARGGFGAPGELGPELPARRRPGGAGTIGPKRPVPLPRRSGNALAVAGVDAEHVPVPPATIPRPPPEPSSTRCCSSGGARSPCSRGPDLRDHARHGLLDRHPAAGTPGRARPSRRRSGSCAPAVLVVDVEPRLDARSRAARAPSQRRARRSGSCPAVRLNT